MTGGWKCQQLRLGVTEEILFRDELMSLLDVLSVHPGKHLAHRWLYKCEAQRKVLGCKYLRVISLYVKVETLRESGYG